jgi:hypothetical protein
MALALRSLVLEHSVPHTTDVAPVNWYKYATADAVATVIADGYFNNARDKLRVNDVIDAMCVANGVGDRVSLKVLTVPASGNVTTAVNTDASGA